MLNKVVPLSNDMLDKHGQKMSIEALEDAQKQTNDKIMVSHSEHDFSCPPIGRMNAAHLTNEEGVNWLLGEFVLFEESDIEKENPLGNRELAVHNQDAGAVRIISDRSYEISGLSEDVDNLQKLFDINESTQFELKKSAEPISTLTLLIGVGGFVVAGFLNGFLQESGKEAWTALKSLVNKNKEINNEEAHIQFIFDFENEYYKVEIMVVFKNFPANDIEKELKLKQELIEQKVIQYYESGVRAGRIVFLAEAIELKHIYSVYKCGTPFDIADRNEYLTILESKKQQM